MYMALFLAPWMLMYALSTMAMNHRHSFKAYYGGEVAAYEKEREQAYNETIGPEASTEVIARRILTDLNMDGRHFATRSGDRITIYRDDPLQPRRITYAFESRKLLVERRLLRAPAFLEEMHRRRGYESPYAADDLWAFSVDVVILAMIFWAASGLWMWWEMKATRGWGALSAVVGLGLFVMFLLTI